MSFETIIVGNREYALTRMNVLLANTLLMRIQKVAMPVIGSLMDGGKGLGDIDVKEAAKVISENLDESMIANIVIPMFKGCALSDVESKRKLDSEAAINQAFTVENLLDLYELIFEVGRFQFSPFLEQLKSRFGNLLDAKPKAKLTES